LQNTFFKNPNGAQAISEAASPLANAHPTTSNQKRTLYDGQNKFNQFNKFNPSQPIQPIQPFPTNSTLPKQPF
jgi:hypothetical protein